MRSGEEALARLAEIDPDVILMDIMLPGIDGCALLGEIHPLHKELPIVMMTAAGSVEIHEINGATTSGPARVLRVTLQKMEIQILRKRSGP